MRARTIGLRVTRLLNIFDPASDRVRFHATRRELVAAQADAIGIELRQYGVAWDRYETAFLAMLAELRDGGFAGVVFGDIHLADVRAWFEERVRTAALEHVEPIWGDPPGTLLAEFVRSGSRAIVTCVETTKLPDAWLGRVIDEEFVRDIAGTRIDPAGENGEYHSFAFAGPPFNSEVRFRTGARRDDGRFAQLDLEPISTPPLRPAPVDC